MTLRVAVAVALLLAVAHACSCIAISVDQAREQADAVFRGTVVQIHDANRDIITDILQPRKQMVVFRVSRVWKGDVGERFEMALPHVPPDVPCRQWGEDAKIGNELLVYARRSPAGDEYVSSFCYRTAPTSRASKDFEQLGPGKPPEKKATLTSSDKSR